MIGLVTLPILSNAAFGGVALGSSLQDCIDLFDTFEATNFGHKSGAAAKPFRQDGSQLISCDFVGLCPDGISRQTCSWLRFFSVNCETVSGNVFASIRTNSLPNHCYDSKTNPATGSSTEFNAYEFYQIRFNLEPRLMLRFAGLSQSNSDSIFTTINSQLAYNTVACSNGWALNSLIDANIIDGNEFVYNPFRSTPINDDWSYTADFYTRYPHLKLTSSNSIVGVARNGVFIFSGLTFDDYDAFFPASYGAKNLPKKVSVDLCLGTTETYNVYRYHMYSPCMFDITVRYSQGGCTTSAICRNDVIDYAKKMTLATQRTFLPIGLAKDGRIIYGPYKENGNLWQPCEVDICNGRLFGDNYAYVATMFFPYVVGCWGPGNLGMNYKAECSSKPRLCKSGFQSLQSPFLIVIATLTFVLFSFYN
ncbi:UNKNOWN [Stylonychia lemnae]|uniref:YHYH domain containing protein n=1 Tax=Stylonychia lemnae TaxID=5949 RepID=A0A077ZZH3_STYLE|nr:UNKNOWN [Stylonychia lemnae]|eukprot:CDW74997.1 UNKNOWN [Stylonychia lemnae]